MHSILLFLNIQAPMGKMLLQPCIIICINIVLYIPEPGGLGYLCSPMPGCGEHFSGHAWDPTSASTSMKTSQRRYGDKHEGKQNE